MNDTSQSFVKFEKIDKSYDGEVLVVKNLNLDIAKGEFVTMLGPSGSGKTTTLMMLAGFETPTNGEIFLDTKPISKIPPYEREIGMVFQKPNPFPKSIFDNVAYGLKIQGINDKKFIAERVEKALKQADLWNEVKDDLKKSALSLSGGQQQRLCIARTLAVEPSIILMDEPTSALDPISTAKIEELIFELKEKYTIIIVTHNMQQASRISDYTAFFYLGELIEFDKTKKIFTNPEKQQTENYITGRFG